jgi:hypothetical protein
MKNGGHGIPVREGPLILMDAVQQLILIKSACRLGSCDLPLGRDSSGFRAPGAFRRTERQRTVTFSEINYSAR